MAVWLEGFVMIAAGRMVSSVIVSGLRQNEIDSRRLSGHQWTSGPFTLPVKGRTVPAGN